MPLVHEALACAVGRSIFSLVWSGSPSALRTPRPRECTRTWISAGTTRRVRKVPARRPPMTTTVEVDSSLSAGSAARTAASTWAAMHSMLNTSVSGSA